MKQHIKSKLLIGAGILGLLALTGCGTVDKINTVYRFTEDVHQGTIDKILYRLDAAEEVITPNETFTLIVTSNGGSVKAYKTLQYRLALTKLKLVTKVHSYAYSAGAMMFIMGDVRIIEEEAELLFHYARYVIRGVEITQDVMEKYLKDPMSLDKATRNVLEDYKDRIKRWLAEFKVTNKKLFDIVAHELGVKIAKKLMVKGKDITITGKEALKMGVATEIYSLEVIKKRLKGNKSGR